MRIKAMDTGRFELDQTGCRADIIARNSKGQTVLLAEVKGTALNGKEAKHRAISQLKFYLQAANTDIPFAMLADLEDIDIFHGGNANLSKPVISFKTAAVLSHYDPEFGSKRIFEQYLGTLVEAWLRDLAYHWKSKVPPASEQLAAIGLLQQLEGGTTQAEVKLGSDTLH
jgi:hypothetical protein